MNYNRRKFDFKPHLALILISVLNLSLFAYVVVFHMVYREDVWKRRCSPTEIGLVKRVGTVNIYRLDHGKKYCYVTTDINKATISCIEKK